MAKQNLGMVTAYAYAVVGGYEGTEAEFEALLGNIATDLAEIENLTVIANTLPPGSSATASYDHGVLTLGIPKGDKGDTGAGATVTAGTTATGDPGTNASVTSSGTTKDAVFNFTIPRGDTGNGIESIYLTGTSGAVKTYTILFTDGNTTTFDVTDGEVTNAQLTAAVTDLKEDFTLLLPQADIEYHLNFTDGKYLNSSGNIGASSAHAATEGYYEVAEGQKLYFNLYETGTESAIAFYSDTKVSAFVSKVTSQGNEVITVPTGARYARFSTTKAVIPVASAFVKNIIIPIERGFLDDLEKTELSIIERIKNVEYTYPLVWTDGYYLKASNGTPAASANYQYTQDYYRVFEGGKLDVLLNGAGSSDCAIAYYDEFYKFVSSEFNSSLGTFTVPSGVKYARFSNGKNTVANPYVKNHVDNTNDDEITISGNVLDKANLTRGYTILASGALSASASMATTDFIEVNEGDVVVVSYANSAIITMSRLVTYNAGKIVTSGNTTDATSFTVPSGCKYVRFSANDEYITSGLARVNLTGQSEKYEPYYKKETSKAAQNNGTDISNVLRYPLTTLPDYVLNNMAYKPLGELSKGYICFTSDDGFAEDATYTIPTFISKDVPCTLAMFSKSQILQTESGVNAVLEAVNDHGFCISQHDNRYWTNFGEYNLETFFNSEMEFWDDLGVSVYGAVNPGTACNNLIKALAGGKFGSFRADYYEGKPYYDDYMCGPRSNLYGLSSNGIVDHNIAYWEDKCDKALANHWLLMIHFHGNSLDATSKETLEATIDYAKNIGLTFITMEDIPNLT